jgi:hypothetical protein
MIALWTQNNVGHKTNTVEPCFYVPIIYVFLSFETFLKSLQFPHIHSVLFTLILCFQNVKLPVLYIFSALTEGTVRHKIMPAEIFLLRTYFFKY